MSEAEQDRSQSAPASVVAGWREQVALPEWGVRRLRAKLDTGARTSALHVANLRETPEGTATFDIVLGRGKNARRRSASAPIVRLATVRPTSGHDSDRVVVETDLVIGPLRKRIEVSLVCRQKMIHRMLLGRTALAGDVLIDPGAEYRLGAPGDGEFE